jgi:hypothetical protein
MFPASPTCIIVGAGPGLGLAVAERYARESFAVYMLSQKPGLLAAGVARLRRRGLNVLAVEGDFPEAHGFDCDVLIFNALVEGGHNVDLYEALAYVNPIIGAMQAKDGGAVLFSTYEGPAASALREVARGLMKEAKSFGMRIGIVTIDAELPTSRAKLNSIADVYWELFVAADSLYESEVRVHSHLLGQSE